MSPVIECTDVTPGKPVEPGHSITLLDNLFAQFAQFAEFGSGTRSTIPRVRAGEPWARSSAPSSFSPEPVRKIREIREIPIHPHS